jgi:hypothetical protein
VPSGKKSKRARAGTVAPGTPPPRRPAGRSTTWRSPLVLGGAAVVVIAAVVIAVVLATSGGGGSSAQATEVDFSKMVNLQTGPPPWNADDGDLQGHLSDVDLTGMSSEALAFHIHSHLDLWVNGKKVTVPALIGISEAAGFITEVHTHTPDGVIHVESPVQKDYTLGQFFGEWGVRLSSTCIGSLCGTIKYWVDGKPQVGNPAAITLTAHKEIAIALGKAPTKIPTHYSFPAGE